MKFCTFVPVHTLLNSVLHFFPSSEKVVAPYPVTCKLSFFSEKKLIKSLALDGLRLSHPDGVRMRDLLGDAGGDAPGGLIGVEIDIDTKGRNTDLSLSDCIVELECQGESLQYRALSAGKSGQENAAPHRVPLFCGSIEEEMESLPHHTSLVLINSSERPQQYTYRTTGRSDAESVEILLEPRAVVERRLDDSVNESRESLQMIDIAPGESGGSVIGYVMYRDVKTNLPLSVSAL